MDSIVLKRVIGGYYKGIQKRQGILKDFKRVKVKEAHYPAIVDSKGDKVEGLVVYGIASDALLLLDEFEDDQGNVRFSWIKKKGKHKRAKKNTKNN